LADFPKCRPFHRRRHCFLLAHKGTNAGRKAAGIVAAMTKLSSQARNPSATQVVEYVQ
jgi:hypothetical protein